MEIEPNNYHLTISTFRKQIFKSITLAQEEVIVLIDEEIPEEKNCIQTEFEQYVCKLLRLLKSFTVPGIPRRTDNIKATEDRTTKKFYSDLLDYQAFIDPFKSAVRNNKDISKAEKI